MITKVAAERALCEALRSGGDFAELFMEDSRTGNIAMLDGKVDTSTIGRRRGAGIRVYRGANSVYVHANDTSLENLIKIARQAADAVGKPGAEKSVELIGSYIKNIHAIQYLPMDVDSNKKAKLMRSVHAAAKSVDPAISQVQIRLSGVESDIIIANTDGLFTGDKRVYSRMYIIVIASDGAENQTGYEGPGAMAGYELFEEKLDVEALARKAAATAVTMLRAEPCPAGTMPVVMDGGFGGVVFHEACGHSLEATSVALGNSEFCGKLNQQIASRVVTAIDDGTLPNEWGSINIDDEGAPTAKLVLIENGVLKNYMIDRLNGRRMGMPATGSARRQDYTFAPTSRMRNTYIAPGEDDEDEIIRTAGDALYAKQMGGGSVNPSTGEFNFAVDESYLIKDGKIDRPVRGASLIGKGGEVLMRIDRVGRNMTMAAGMCGSISGSVPTNVGQPMIRITSLTVGGR